MSVDTHDLVKEIGQFIIAALILIGTGYAVLIGSPHTVELMPFASVIVTYYYMKNNTNGNGNGNGVKVTTPSGGAQTTVTTPNTTTTVSTTPAPEVKA